MSYNSNNNTLPGGPSSSTGGGGPQNPNKTKQVQQQVDEVVGIMHENINKVMERGEKLDSLQTKTEDLQQGALQFKRGAIWGRLLTMRALGVPAPAFGGFALFRNWLRIPTRDKLRSFAGTARRIYARGYRRALRP